MEYGLRIYRKLKRWGTLLMVAASGTAVGRVTVSGAVRSWGYSVATAYCFSSFSEIYSRAEAWVDSSTTGGATPASRASFHREAHKHQRSPRVLAPETERPGTGVERSLPLGLGKGQEFFGHLSADDVGPGSLRPRYCSTRLGKKTCHRGCTTGT